MSEKRLAVLIDAENVKGINFGEVLAEIAKYGTAIVKRAYGNWTTGELSSWKQDLLDYSIQPRQQFAYTKGKNASDIALVIEAMDLLHTERFDGFCLVSNDSDFTPLAARIREAGLRVYGIGEEGKVPKPFVAACDKFIFTNILAAQDDDDETPHKKTRAELRGDVGLVNLLREAVAASSGDDGWANLGPVGGYISKKKPEFDARNYGYAKLSDLVRATELFEVENRASKDQTTSALYIKRKK